METLSHFLFEVIKILILSCIYTFVIIVLVRLISKNYLRKKKSFLILGICTYFILFVFMFTHWGNHGFGDSVRIPLNNGYSVRNINWDAVAYIEDVQTENNVQIETTKFMILDKKILGNLKSKINNYDNKYFYFNLKTKQLNEFKSEDDFDNFLKENHLPDRKNFLTFEENYDNYWNGWRFWLLP